MNFRYLDRCRNAGFFYQFQQELSDDTTQEGVRDYQECVCQDCPEIVCPSTQIPENNPNQICNARLEKLNIVKFVEKTSLNL